MRFLTKIRDRQFAKKWGGAYNLSRAVLAGVLAAGCLMPGFAEAAEFNLDDETYPVGYTKVENTATITENIGMATGPIVIFWNPGISGTVVEGCTINVNDVNSTKNMTITPEIHVIGGNVLNGNAKSNTVNISNVIFTDSAYIYGGYSKSVDYAFYSGYTSSNGTVTGNTVTIKDTTFEARTSIYGGYTDSGTVNDNRVIISGGEFIGRVYGGRGQTAADGNSVIISDGNITGNVYGGRGNTAANGNSVIISGGNITGNVYGGCASGTANGNSVIISGGTFNDYVDVWGGYAYSDSGEANNNKVILVGKNATYPLSAEQTLTGSGNINIDGTVYGGHVFGSNSYNGTGNEIHVYGSDTKVGKIDGFNTLRFFVDDTMTFGETMLTINGISDPDTGYIYPDVSIPNNTLAVKVTGKPQASGDKNTIYLVHINSGEITDFNNVPSVPVEFGELLTSEGTVALENNNKDLVLTLKNITVNENGKSLVETRAAAAFVVNNMSDFMLGTGMEQAKAAAGGVTPIAAGTMAPFAAVGGSNMRYTTGSYVDVNGWNGAVGFAKQADKLLFGVAVEHGRGNYDSYMDNGMHASGDIKSTGGVIFGEYKLDNGVHYDAALRAGRVKSDYNSTATSYDESSTYYGFSLGGGKELAVSDKATLDVYGRYYFSHTNGSDVSIATGEEIDFDAVNSHRLRIGGRYTTTLTEKSKAYAGLAWQYEFGGDAKAAVNGYSAPTPSLQGHSAIVEAGYKLNAGKNLTLDFNLNGAMGKQRGIGGGIGAQWLF